MSSWTHVLDDSGCSINFCGGVALCSEVLWLKPPESAKLGITDTSAIFFLFDVEPQIKRGLSNKRLNLTAFPRADVR